MTDLRMEFRPANLLPLEQPQITDFCRAVRTNNWSELGSSTEAGVYSHNSRWWHANANDPRLHVTVRYNRRVPATRRVHIYQDGTANLYPHIPPRPNLAAVDEEGSDGSVELSDEEVEEVPEQAGN